MPSEDTASLLQSILRDAPSAAAALFWLFFALVVSLVLGARVIERREYVLEQ